MSNLSITPRWHDTINQVEVNEDITGGADGNANLATKQLAENVFWLKQQLQQSSTGQLPIGTIIHINKHFATATAFAQHMGYGTWKRALQGRVAVGFSDKASDPSEYKTHGKEYGTSTVTLQEKHIPPHEHEQRLAQENTPVRYVWNTGNGQSGKQAHYDKAESKGSPVTTGSWGGENGSVQPLNIQPPSRTIDAWERIA